MVSVTVIIPISMIVVGSWKMDSCPAAKFVPVYLVVGGIPYISLVENYL